MTKRVLLVDDATFMRVMLKNILTQNGFEVAGEAENGLIALEAYKRTKPDLVIMDIQLPEMDGITVLKTLKDQYKNGKFIMCSAMAKQNLVIESIRAGATDFIVKPFQEARVIEAVKKIFG
jgi:two-component system, chemotaxis family, chemotaxis protein CheY